MNKHTMGAVSLRRCSSTITLRTPSLYLGKRALATSDRWGEPLALTLRPLDDSDRAWSILLALESEWDKGNSHTTTREMVLDVASKPTALRAAVKVLITVTATKYADELEQDIRILRSRTHGLSPMLWINLPNEGTADNCQYVIFGNKIGTIRRRLS